MHMCSVVMCGLLTVLCLVTGVTVMADQVLFDFEGGFDLAAVEARDVRVSEARTEGGVALRIDSSHHEDWPGITLKAPSGKWDLSAYGAVALDVRNVGTNEVAVFCRVDNPGADGVVNCNTDHIVLAPGESGTLRVRMVRRAPGPQVHLFGMRGYPPQARGERGTVDTANITQLIVFVAKPTADHAFEIDNVRATGTAEPLPPSVSPEAFFPFIDTFGQFMHKEWPGKTHSVEEMAQRLREEEQELQARPGPPGWNEFGGWADGPSLEATGFFRVQKWGGKWWLVDPTGKLFWSHGIDCVAHFNTTPIEERESWFHDFPGDQPEFEEFLGTAWVLHGHYAGRTVKCFNFCRANLKRKYGPDWRERFADMAHRRLRSWGMNTIGNWSEWSVYLQRRTPYVACLSVGSKRLEGSTGYWGQFPDVFDPDFRAKAREAMAGHVGSSAGDPWCIGYFVDNELSWGNEVSLAIATLASPPDQAAKIAFAEDLKAKYGTIEKLNEQWGTRHESWEAFLESRALPGRQGAEADLLAFYTRTAEHYFRVCREAVKEVAPNNLYLGCRFAWVNDLAANAAAKYCDVVSYNLYRTSVADLKLPGNADVPVIIGEFHFGALDRGPFHTGLVPVGSQEERARAYKEYVTGALAHAQFVGCHWFEYMDEPTTGRAFDEENYQIGFLDECDTPYPETIAACREVGYNLYRLRSEAR